MITLTITIIRTVFLPELFIVTMYTFTIIIKLIIKLFIVTKATFTIFFQVHFKFDSSLITIYNALKIPKISG